MTTKQQIRAEIERRKELLTPHNGQGVILCREIIKQFDKLLSFLDTLEEPVSEDLKEEVRQYYSNNCTWDALKQPMLSIITRCARHFAEWGAEHLADASKMISDDLEEAAEKLAIEYAEREKPKDADGETWRVGDVMIENRMSFEDGFKAGAEWMKRKMMEGAVEGKVFMSFAPGHNQMVMADVDLPTNTNVKIIIVKED